LGQTFRTDVDIRLYSEGDFPLLECLLGDPAMMVHLGGPESPEALRERHERYIGYDGSSEGLFTIVVGPDRADAGWAGYWASSWQGDAVWECGWHVLPEFQGRGVASAGAALMLDRARMRGLHRFAHAFPSVGNAASNALCARLGFELLGSVEVEYPKGSMMCSNDWRLDLTAGGSG
jgi:RimJ/RimL family protein N-acetyltransferase